ncbi:glycosyltransferase family 2 protein [Aureimonas leprariae]|uniref:Glycosyltransferase family 2 protein n=1 Tax=Plantimonas leprariae TaxID=2615207 RepID=A0A7V7PSQ3_9HYPH|nr:galactosyltransferase-related protein [Aureimonas leprariae]KAB0682629.1 glycosyltransferase family 2 protein [Aureimonas leprariae]
MAGNSVLTLVRGRRTHLANLMRSLAVQTVPPAELVIAWMQPEPATDLPDPGCPVRHVLVAGEPMPLAAARNRAAEAASSDQLVFLDVDCIASPTLVENYAAAGAEADGLFLGEVYYLPAGAVGEGELDFAALDRIGTRHPAKPEPPKHGIRLEPDAGELWGLSFALPRERYLRIGGMDERFAGYGAEETDFACRMADSDLPTYWLGRARAYHQHHAVHVPPLQHFGHILRNAALYLEKHGAWCMTYWLGQFRDAGLIDWREDGDSIAVLREPETAEIVAALQGDERLFS